METTQASRVAKRRLTRHDMQGPMQREGSRSAKKECADCVKVKKDKTTKQEADLETPLKPEIEVDDLWLRVKQEIKEEMQLGLKPSGFQVGEQEDQDLPGYHQAATKDRIGAQSNKAATGQPPTEPERKPVAKRPRLTRKDMQGPMQTEGSRSAKKECSDGVKVKKEDSAEQEAGFENPQKAAIEADDLWLWVKKELDMLSLGASSLTRAVKSPPSGSSVSHLLSSQKKVEAGKEARPAKQGQTHVPIPEQVQ